MTYLDAIKYLESLINYEKIPAYPYKESVKLERIKDFLKSIGNPQYRLRCIHVAGTKGKGSTSAFCAYILREARYKVGLYTSPHLSDFRERIRILSPQSTLLRQGFGGQAVHSPQNKEFEGMISKKDLANFVARLKPRIKKYQQISKYGPLSFFEVYTALAFVYFKAKKVDFVVLETGLGGRLDATNTADALVSVITSISYEHMDKLGTSLHEIAQEKAGIIKCRPQSTLLRQGFGGQAVHSPQLIVISAPQGKEAELVIKNRCKEVSARLYRVGREIRYHASTVHPPSPLDSLNDGRASADARRNISTPNFFSGEGGHRPPSTEKFKVRGILGEYEDLKIRLLGEHQLINAAAAIGAIEALKMQGIKVGVDAIRKGLYNTLWPGRAEVVSRKPYIVLDGAQNQASARALKEAILENFQYQKMILVLGISQDKDIKGICRELIPLADEIVLTQANNPRAAPVGKIEKVIIVHRPPSYAKASEGRQSTDHSKKSRGPCLPTGKAGTVDRGQILKSKDVKQALKLAKIKATKKDLILVTGSLFVVGEARELLKK